MEDEVVEGARGGGHDPTPLAVGSAGVLLTILIVRCGLILWMLARRRRTCAREIERRTALGLAPIAVRVEADTDPVRLATGEHFDDGLHWDPVHLTAETVRLRASSGEHFEIPAGTSVLAIGIPSVIQGRGDFSVPKGTPFWLLAPRSRSGEGPYRDGVVRLDGDVELSEQRAFLELAPPPRHRPRWWAWGILVAVLGTPLLPGVPAIATIIAANLLIGCSVIALTSMWSVSDHDALDQWVNRVFLRPIEPRPARHEPRPWNHGTNRPYEGDASSPARPR